MNHKSVIIIIALFAAVTHVGAQQTATGGQNPHTQVGQKRVLPLVTTKIRLLTRAYGDSIVLRWIAEDFVSWKYLAETGVNILRVQKGERRGLNIDTLAYGLKPLTLEQFQAKYPSSDSLALIPPGVLYGDGENRKKDSGMMGRSLEYNNEQDISFSFAMMVAEWRKDLARDMAVRFTDTTVKPGATYDYYVQPTVWENGGKLIFEPGVAEDVVNEPYKAPDYRPQMIDSLSTPYTIVLGWWDAEHSSFEIERRRVSTLLGVEVDEDWTHVNRKPYVSMVEQPEDEHYQMLSDSVPELGVWEYRVQGYDAFADLTEFSPARRIVVRDIMPPSAPVLKRIVLARPDENDPMAKVIANIIWEKDTLEQDLAGYRIFYNAFRNEGDPWRPMNIDLLAPTDTFYSVDVTGLRTGMMYIAAYDDAGNESRSFMQQIRLTDYKAPDPPTGLKATIMPVHIDSLEKMKELKTQLVLSWHPCPDDDIAYYDIAAANDTTHAFIVINQGGIRENVYTDTITIDANQKYIYYKVRATDYSTNIGLWSHWIEVARPHLTPPTVPHIHASSYNEQNGIHMEWVVGKDEDMKRHIVYRRTGEQGEWQEIARYGADSLRYQNYTIVIDDNPPYLQTARYYYCVESINASPFRSQSLAISFNHRGPRVFDIPVKLAGSYIVNEGETRLVWDIDTKRLPNSEGAYLCIYRKGPGETKFTYQRNVPIAENVYSDHQMRQTDQEQKAEYYVHVQYADGRRGLESNTVTVTAPSKVEKGE